MTYVMIGKAKSTTRLTKNTPFSLPCHDTHTEAYYSMNIDDYGNKFEDSQTKMELVGTIEKIDETCSRCKPLSMVSCVTNCKVWRLKNELRELHKRTQEKDFTTSLLNTIKSRRRQQILDLVCKGHHSISRLQDELKKQGYYHSQNTILEEYINPLIKNDLVKVDQETYYPTLFGAKLNELTTNSFDLETILPPHSECYEETVLSSLASEPKTYEDLKGTISPVNLARVISRLQKTQLVETSKEKDYVFFFTTKRNPAMEQLSQTEKKIYDNIPETGISAKKIAERAKISVRRTYKYLRRLKGKKMVFSRKKPKLYTLTDRGLQTATILKEICDLAYQIPAIASRLVKARHASGPEVEVSRMESAEDNVSIPITVMRRTRLNHP